MKTRKRTSIFTLMSLFLVISLMAGLFVPAAKAADEEEVTPIWLDESGDYTMEERAVDLVSRLTLDEKASQMSNSMAAISRLNVPKFSVWNEALHGIRTSKATSYPISVAMGSTWNPDIVKEMTDAISNEARAISNSQTLGLTFWSPVVEPQRDPRWGRHAETYSEDTFLIGALGTAFADGLMGDDDVYVKSYATGKHFLANSIENVRMSGTSHTTETELYEYYARPYRIMLLSDKLESVMTAYNRVNNIPMSASITLVDTLARQKWGMEGYVTGDCKAVSLLYSSYNYVGDRFADLEPSLAIASAYGLLTGVDTDCTTGGVKYYSEAVNLGYVTEADLDEAVATMFKVRLELGQLYTGQPHPWQDLTTGEHREAPYQQELALRMAEEAVVLLENENNMLPLKASDLSGKKVAVVGPYANKVDLGGYSGTPTEANKVSPWAALNTYVAEKNLDTELVLVTGGEASVPSKLFNIRDFTLHYKNGTTKTYTWNDINYDESTGLREYNDWSGNWMMVVENGATVTFDGVKTTDVDHLTFHSSSSQSGVAVDIEVKVSDALVPIQKYTGVTTTRNIEFPFNGDAQADGKLQFVFTVAEKEFVPSDLDPVADADLFLVFVGAGTDIAGEELDRPYLHLPGTQPDLVQYIADNFENVVVVIEAMGMMEVENFKDKIDALLWYGYNGQAQGTAITNVLFGEVNPSGKLPFTWYQGLQNIPDMFDYTLTGTSADGLSTGRTYMYYNGKISYPFGYGKSYTTYRYTNMKLSQNTFTPNDDITVSVDVTNTGKVDGYEIVQVYYSAPNASDPDRPNKQLIGFDKVWIPAGQTKTVEIVVDAAEMWYYDDPTGNSLNQEETPKGEKNTSADHILDGKLAYLNGEYVFEVASAASNLTNNGSASNSLKKTATMEGELELALQNVYFASGTVDTGKPQVVKVGDLIQSYVAICLNDDTFMDPADAKITYSSNRNSVATVDANGLVTAVGEGVVTITATVEYKGKTMSDDFALKVMPADFILSTEAHNVKADQDVAINACWAEPVNSNTAVLKFAYDTEILNFVRFTPAAGVTVVNTETTAEGVEVVLMISDYSTQDYGDLILHTKAGAELTNQWIVVRGSVDYVELLADGTKEIKSISTSVSFTTSGNGNAPYVPGDTNGDDVLDLIDLSNMIDWFGYKSSNPDWDAIYTFFDFNNNGEIDIYDIAYVANLVK